MCFCDEDRVRVVPLALGHFRTVLGQNDTVDDQVLEGSCTLDSGGDDHEGVEPASGLIETFSNEICWESLIELLIADREWVVALSIRHGTTLEPTVEDLWNSSEKAFVRPRWNGDLVNVFSVQVSERTTSRQLLELSDRAVANNLFHIFLNPKRNWISPIPVSREAKKTLYAYLKDTYIPIGFSMPKISIL